MPDRSNVFCPICKRALPQGAAQATQPFCSARCKMVDLGNWLGGGYVIASPAFMSADLDALAEAGDSGDMRGLEETLANLLREPS